MASPNQVSLQNSMRMPPSSVRKMGGNSRQQLLINSSMVRESPANVSLQATANMNMSSFIDKYQQAQHKYISSNSGASTNSRSQNRYMNNLTVHALNQPSTQRSVALKAMDRSFNFQERDVVSSIEVHPNMIEHNSGDGLIACYAFGPKKKPRYINEKLEQELKDFRKQVEKKFAQSALNEYIFPYAAQRRQSRYADNVEQYEDHMVDLNPGNAYTIKDIRQQLQRGLRESVNHSIKSQRRVIYKSKLNQSLENEFGITTTGQSSVERPQSRNNAALGNQNLNASYQLQRGFNSSNRNDSQNNSNSNLRKKMSRQNNPNFESIIKTANHNFNSHTPKLTQSINSQNRAHQQQHGIPQSLKKHLVEQDQRFIFNQSNQLDYSSAERHLKMPEVNLSHQQQQLIQIREKVKMGNGIKKIMIPKTTRANGAGSSSQTTNIINVNNPQVVIQSPHNNTIILLNGSAETTDRNHPGHSSILGSRNVNISQTYLRSRESPAESSLFNINDTHLSMKKKDISTFRKDYSKQKNAFDQYLKTNITSRQEEHSDVRMSHNTNLPTGRIKLQINKKSSRANQAQAISKSFIFPSTSHRKEVCLLYSPNICKQISDS